MSSYDEALVYFEAADSNMNHLDTPMRASKRFKSRRRRGLRLGWLFILVNPLLVSTAAAQAISFTDVSERAGLVTDGGGRGVAVHDVDGDGWDDVFISVAQGTSALFRNNTDGTFTNIAEAAGVAVIGNYTVALWGDVDNDGHVDLFLGRVSKGANKLFLGNSDGTFTDVSDRSGLDPTMDVSTAAFGDVDGDGALDLFAALDRAPDVLFRNTQGAGATFFEDVSEQAGIAGSAQSVPMQATWIDYDHDNDLDLFCVHDSRTPSRLYQNPGFLPLIDTVPASRIHTYPSETVCCNMGIAWGDYDGDGWEDAYVTRIGQGGLYHNNGDGTFTDVAGERGALRNGMSWGVVFADFDNDGDQDLFIVSTSGYDGTPTLLYENQDGQFSEVGARAGASFLLEAQGLASGDFNQDGRPDLLIPTHGGNHKLLLNTTQTAGHWIALRLQGEVDNRMAVGARVEVVAGGQTHLRAVSGGDSYASQSSPRLHIGLGEANRIDTLRIRWGNGAVQMMTGLAVDRAYAFVEGVVATSRASDAAPPQAFHVGPNYPNPFRTHTTITYTVPEAGFVRLEVLDVLGRRVGVVVDGVLPAGTHTVTFEAGPLPSGLYVYRLQAGERVETKHMLRVK